MRKSTPGPSTVAELMNPRSVAVIGASEDQNKFGGRLYRYLLKHGYEGAVYPINPARKTLLGIPAYTSIAEIPLTPDIAVLALPQPKIKASIEEAAARGVRGCIIITAKFSDAGPEGARQEQEIVEVARAHGMRLVGPNCLGIISPASRLVLCSSPALDVEELPLGSIGLVSQSGALMATIFDRALAMGVGFSHCVSVGNQADLELCDFVEYLIDDERTQILCTYIEGIKDASRFVALARRARKVGKPWLLVKAGRTEAGTRAAFSHTASLTGSHAVLSAVCRDENVTMLDDMGTMITLAAELTRYPHQRVERLAILTTSGGGGALAADALTARGLSLAEFSPATRQRLSGIYLPGQAENPIDFGGRRSSEAARVGGPTANIVKQDENTDALLVVITTAPMLHDLTREMISETHGASEATESKPTFYVMQPGAAADSSRGLLRKNSVSYTDHLGEAVDALEAWVRRGRFVARSESRRPPRCSDPDISRICNGGELDEAASKALLASYGVPVNAAIVATDKRNAIAAADELGYPVVLKVVSPDIVHKSDIGGVIVGAWDARAVAHGYDRILKNVCQQQPQACIQGISVQTMISGQCELIVGARSDPQFGPVVVFGAGGVLVELLPDRIVACAPLAAVDAYRLLQTLSIWPVLEGYRGASLAVAAIVDVIVRVSWLAHDLRSTNFELDLNPLIVGPSECCAVDARVRISETI